MVRSQRSARAAILLAAGAAAVALTSRSARADNDAYSPDATSGVFSTSFTLGTTAPTAGGTSAPNSGDALFFGPLTTGTGTVSNDLTGFTFAGLTFQAGAPAYNIGGNAFTLSGAITNSGTATSNVSNAITLGAGQTVTTNTGGIILAGVIGDGGNAFGLTKAGSGTLTLTGANTFTGGVALGAGTLNANNSAALGTGTLTLSGGTLSSTAAAAVFLTNGVVVGSGTVNSGGGNLTLGGTLTGSGTLTLGGAGAITSIFVSGTNSMTGGTITVANGGNFVRFSNTAATSAAVAYVLNTGTAAKTTLDVAGTFSFGSLTGSGGLSGSTGTTHTVSVGALNLNDTYSGVLANGTGTTALTKVGTGTFTLTGLSTYTGDTNITNGEVDVVGGGFSSSILQYTGQGGTLGFGTGSGGTIGTLNGSQNLALTNANSAGATLTLAGAAAATYSGVLSGAGGLTKTGAAVQTLTNANTYTGNTLVNLGTLTLANNAGVTVGATASNISVGQTGVSASAALTIDSSAATGSQTTTRAGGLTLNTATGGNGFASFSATAANVTSAKTVDNFSGALTVNTGAYALPKFIAGTLGYEQVNFASFTRNPGGVIDISRGNTASVGATTVASQTAGNENITFTTAPTLVNGVVVGVILNQGLATYTAANGLTQLTGQVTLAASGQTAGTQNVTLASTTPLTLTADESVNSLVLGGATGNGGTTAGAFSLNVSSGMISVGQSSTLGNATVNFGTAEGIIVVQNTRILTVNSVLAGSGGLTIAQNNATQTTANVVLNGANTYTGVTRFISNSGTTAKLTNSLALQNSTLDYNNYGASFTFGNGTTTGQTAYTFGGLTGAQSINLSNNNATPQPVALTLGSAGSADTASTVNAYSGVLSNTVAGGSVIKAGVATQAFSGANTYSGGTTINAGTLQANNATSSLGSGPTTISGGVLAGGTAAVAGATGAGAVNLTAGTITGGTGATASDAIGTLILGTANTSAGSVAITLNGTGTYNAKLDGSRLATSARVAVSPKTAGGNVSAYASASDYLILSGLTAGTSSTLTINPVLVTAGVASFAPSTSYYFIIADAKSSATALDTANLLTLSGSANSGPAGVYSLDTAADASGGDYLLLNFTTAAAPEPTSLLLAGLAAAPLALGRRRRSR